MTPRSLLASALLALAAGCGGGGPLPPPLPPAPPPYTPTEPLPGAASVSFVLPRGGAPVPFFDLPWPNELRRKADGRLDFRGYPGSGALFFDAYVTTAAEDVDGYSVAPVVYFHFDGPLEPPRLPETPRAFASAESPVFLLDVDPASPDRGTFYPLDHRLYTRPLKFVPAHTLAVKPPPGVVLRPGTLYAAVVRRDLTTPPLGTRMDLEILKWTSPREDPKEEAARALHAPVLDQLAALGVGRADVAALAVFRTQVPHAVTARLLTAVDQLPPDRAPRILQARWADELARGGALYHVIEGVYCTPNFQSRIGRAPFLDSDGGRIAFDASGAPKLADVPLDGPYGSGECKGLLRARFVMSMPARPMPATGFPLMVSAHGTGGSATTFLGDDDFAGWAAREGIAVVSTDQPLHGGRGPAPRPGSRASLSLSFAGIPIPFLDGALTPEAAFYNPLHPGAARDNLRQAAVDAMVLARLFTATDFASAHGADGTPLLPPAPGTVAPHFDRARLLAAGHSQGSQSVAVMGAVDPLVRGVILSGCGGDSRLGVLRRRDLPIVGIFSALLGLETGELDELHPLMTLVQTLADPIDPQSYARFYWDPLSGRRPQSVLEYEGMTDSYAPAVTAEALAVALKATPIAPAVKPPAGLSPESRLDELLSRASPVRALAQFRSTKGENGHFVLYREPGAADLAMEFMRAVVRGAGP